MAEECINCGQKISSGGLLSVPNSYFGESTVRLVNFVLAQNYEALCEKCGADPQAETYNALRTERERLKRYMEAATTDFPMMTIGVLPGSVGFRVLGMVTANVSVGTGLFNEFSQGFSDMFGLVNSQTGMAHKVNNGEAAARGILVSKAIQMGANCIIGVDVDYGVTNNNAATVNMQGTAVIVEDLDTLLTPEGSKLAARINAAWQHLHALNRWSQGEIREGEVFERLELPA